MSDLIEHRLSFFERILSTKMHTGLTTTVILGSVIILLIRAILANTKELQRLTGKEEPNIVL